MSLEPHNPIKNSDDRNGSFPQIVVEGDTRVREGEERHSPVVASSQPIRSERGKLEFDISAENREDLQCFVDDLALTAINVSDGIRSLAA